MTLYLRTVDADHRSHGGRLQWPREIDAVVEAPDWDPSPRRGGGLHGLPWGQGDLYFLDLLPDAIWQVVEYDGPEAIDLGGKHKFPRCTLRYIGDREGAAEFLARHAPHDVAIPFLRRHVGDGGVAVVGDRGLAEAGVRGRAEAGDYGSAEAGRYGEAKAGYRGLAVAGDYGRAMAGDSGRAKAGDFGRAEAGDNGRAEAGNYGRAKAGDFGRAEAGDNGRAEAGRRGEANAGYRGLAVAGDHGRAEAGDNGRAVAGFDGHAVAGFDGSAEAGIDGRAEAGIGGRVAAGADGTLVLRYWDGLRIGLAVAYVGEDGIEPNVFYRLDDTGRFVRADGGGR